MFQRLSFDQIPRWRNDRHEEALEAFRRSARYGLHKPPKTGRLGVAADALRPIFTSALALETIDSDTARSFFETHFVPYLINRPSQGFVTGYYEPEIEGSREEQPGFEAPLYRHPPELTKIDPDRPPEGISSGFAFARRTGEIYSEYHDRAAIEDGALSDRKLALVHLRSKVEAFFVHIQGSAKIKLTDGSLMRVTYSGKSGHPYTPIGKFLIDDGLIDRKAMTADALRSWLETNGNAASALMKKNRSFIFFKEVTGISDSDGPVAAGGVPLTAGRSLAVDRLLHTFSTPVWVSSDLSDLETAHSQMGIDHAFDRLMIAQDTGSAIIGPARGDLFIGTGNSAATIAGQIKHAATVILLVPHGLDLTEVS
ncbi:MAG: MltA domain-containing protein [Stappiaceae bacterium]